jgi:hypothetical protein
MRWAATGGTETQDRGRRICELSTNSGSAYLCPQSPFVSLPVSLRPLLLLALCAWFLCHILFSPGLKRRTLTVGPARSVALDGSLRQLGTGPFNAPLDCSAQQLSGFLSQAIVSFQVSFFFF